MTPAGESARKRYVLATRIAMTILALGCLAGIVVPAGLGWDFSNFYNAGRRVAAGQFADIYHATAPIDGQDASGMRFWGAPISAAFFAPLGRWQPTTALILFKIENVAALAAALFWLYRRYRPLVAAVDHQWWAAAFAVMCVLFQPFWTIFRVGGQSTPTVLLLVVGALFLMMRSRLWEAAVLLLLAALIKPTLALLLLFLGIVAGTGMFLRLAAVSVTAGMLSIALLGWPIHREFIDVAIEGSQFSRPWMYNSSLYVAIDNLRLLAFKGLDVPRTMLTLTALSWALKIVVIMLLASLIRQSGRQTWSLPARRHFEMMMAIGFWLFVSQTVWEHYLALLFPLLAYLVAVSDQLPRRARFFIGSILILSLGQNLVIVEAVQAVVHIRSIAGLVVVGVLKSAPLLLTLVVLWFYRRALFTTYASPIWSAAVDGRP